MNGLHDETHAHVLLADEDHEFARRLLGAESVPQRWVAVVAFYSAVHYLGAYFWEQHRIVVTSHRHRGRLMRSYNDLVSIRVSYEHLYRASLDARYEMHAEISEERARELLEIHLARVRQHMLTTLGEQS